MQILENRLIFKKGGMLLGVLLLLTIGANAQFRNKGKIKVRKVTLDFYASIDNIKPGNKISVGQIANGRLLSGNPKVDVVSYRVQLRANNSMHVLSVTGDTFSKELIELLYVTKTNTKIYFDKIMVQATKERVQEIAPISYYIVRGDIALPIQEDTLAD